LISLATGTEWGPSVQAVLDFCRSRKRRIRAERCVVPIDADHLYPAPVEASTVPNNHGDNINVITNSSLTHCPQTQNKSRHPSNSSLIHHSHHPRHGFPRRYLRFRHFPPSRGPPSPPEPRSSPPNHPHYWGFQGEPMSLPSLNSSCPSTGII